MKWMAFGKWVKLLADSLTLGGLRQHNGVK